MSKNINDIIIDDVRETRADVKKILGWVQSQDIRLTVLETKEKLRNSKKQYIMNGLRHISSVVIGGSIVYWITTTLIK